MSAKGLKISNNETGSEMIIQKGEFKLNTADDAVHSKGNLTIINGNFEIRAGDWTCFDCNNLNFAFRVKCNRCGLPKEVSIQKFNINLLKNINLQGTTSNIMFYPHNFQKDKNK
jgi:hypothetical protein